MFWKWFCRLTTGAKLRRRAAKSMVDYTRGNIAISLKNFLARGEIVDGWFRQLERLVRAQHCKI